MYNVNRLLENSKRNDVLGYNIYSMGRYHVSDEDYAAPCTEKWLPPSPGLVGAVAIGYEIEPVDIIIPRIFCQGALLSFSVSRHRWTPAYTDTYYRCEPFGEYRVSGTLVLRERKCFTEDDTFVSHLEFINDDSSPLTLDVSLAVPFETVGDGIYRVLANVLPAGLKARPKLCGFLAARTSEGQISHIVLPPHGRFVLAYGFAFSKSTPEKAEESLNRALSDQDPFAKAEERFNRWMLDNAPRLETENTDVLKVYYYRFFLLKRAIHTPSDVIEDAVFPKKAVYESPFGDWFGCPIGLPIPLQLDELRWMRTETAASDQIDAWCQALGNTQNYIQYTPMAILRYYRNKGDLAMLRSAYPSCRAFTLRKAKRETPEALPVTTGSWQTGAEYQPSFYQFTDPAWDWRCDNEGIRAGFACSARGLYRADECAMYVANLMACRDMAQILGERDDAVYFEKAVELAKKSVIDMLWSAKEHFFLDRDVKADALCDEALTYAGFLPLLCGLGDEILKCAFEQLKGERFASGFSLTSTAKDCPMYWFDSHIVHGGGATKRDPHHYPSSWNGAIWPFATSLVLDSLGGFADIAHEYRALFLKLFDEYTELHFLGGERTLPCIVEHYRVSDGFPLSPYADYFHSKWLDLFFSYWAGIGYEDGDVKFSPMTDEDFVLDGVVLGGVSYRFEHRKEGKDKVICT